MSDILDMLGDAGYALDTPGALLRGLLAGRPGERASGEDLLGSYGLPGGAVGGMAAEMALDPLALGGLLGGAYKGIRGATRAGNALAHSDDANPLLRGIGHLVGDESGALGPGATELAAEVAGRPWRYHSYDPTFDPSRVDPLGFSAHSTMSGELGGVRGVVGLTAADEAARGRGTASVGEIVRDLTFGEDPATGRGFGLDPSEVFRRPDLWRNFPDAGLDPVQFEATVAPRGVLDIRETAAHGGLAPVMGRFADRVWEARQRLARGIGLDWPEIHPGQVPNAAALRIAGSAESGTAQGRRLADVLDPKGAYESVFDRRELAHYTSPLHKEMERHLESEWVRPMDQLWRLGVLNEQLIEQFRPKSLYHGDFWSRAGDRDLDILKALGFDKDPLRQFLADEGYDAILGRHNVRDYLGHNPDRTEAALNILDARAIRSWQPRARPQAFDWRPEEMLPEDFYAG